jgi:YHS domain-containing protein
MKCRTIVLVSAAIPLVMLLFSIYAVAQEAPTAQKDKTTNEESKASTPMMGCCPCCAMFGTIGASATDQPQAMMQQCTDMMQKAGITPNMIQQCRIIMQSRVFLDSPEAIYAQAETLGLSEQQKKQLTDIQNEARKKALAVLTTEQREKIGDIPDEPVTMAGMCQKMSRKMMPMMHKMMGDKGAAGSMMMCPMMQQMSQSTDTQAQTSEQTTCPVMGGKINKSVFIEYKGKKVYFCCPGCIDKFKANPEQYVAKLPQFKP